ncbi:MAG: TonB-dependent receptor, partial [Acidobacteria bacterium]|nr:TonB-dependent receptor [Acidobacteriota bacterium]
GFDLKTLRFPQNFVDFAQPFIPMFNISGVTSLGRNRSLIQPRETPAGSVSLSKQLSKHFLKFGADLRKYQFNVNRNLNSSGTFNFGANFTQGPNPFQSSADAGLGLASFLLGAGAGGSIFKEAALSLYRYYNAYYIQDDWKVTPRLTVNLGLRYDLNIGTRERFDRLNSLNLDAPSPLSEKVGFPLRGILEFRGQGTSRDLFELDKNDFAPRFGLAYQWSQNTVVRAGYGVFYVPLIAINNTGTQGFEADTPWVTSLDGLTPLNLLSNPFPQGFNVAKGDRSPLTDVGTGIASSVRSNRTGYTQQWNLSIQRQFRNNLLVDVAYLGNKGTKLTGASHQLNQLPNRFLELGPALNQLVDNPFFGVIPSGPLSGRQVARRQLLLPFPQYTSVSSAEPSWASSIYHAATLKVEKRAAEGLSLLASYTVGKQIDDSSSNRGWGGADSILDHENRRAERSLADLDVPQRLVLSYVLDLPVGRGKRFGTDLHPVANALVGNWSFSGIATFQSGQLVRVSRPSVNNGRSAKLDNRTLERWFDTSAFLPAAPFTFGNVGPLLPDVRADGINNFDFSLAKNFLLRERFRVQFRGEFFNAFNTPQFGLPTPSVTSSTFGVVSSQLNAPRAIQFGLQVYW